MDSAEITSRLKSNPGDLACCGTGRDEDEEAGRVNGESMKRMGELRGSGG